MIAENSLEIARRQESIPGYQLDTELWRGPLAEAVEGLEGLTAAVAAEEREAEATLTAKHAAIGAYDRARPPKTPRQRERRCYRPTKTRKPPSSPSFRFRL